MKSEVSGTSQALQTLNRFPFSREARPKDSDFAAVRVIAEASDELEAARLIAAHKPDLVFLDISMARLIRLDALHQLAKKNPEVPIVVLSAQSEESHAVRSQDAAVGFLSPSAMNSVPTPALNTVMKHKISFSPKFSADSLGADATNQDDSVRPLTPRQHEVLRMVADGSSTKQIALDLGISAKTVETHRAQLMARLDIHDVAGLVRYAIRMGIVNIK